MTPPTLRAPRPSSKLRSRSRAVPARWRLRPTARTSRRRGAQVAVRPRTAGTPKILASSIAYMPFGPVQGLTLGNGVQVANSFDFDYRLTGTQASLGGAALQSLALTYDPASNVETIADAVTPGLSQSFQYNLGGHVTRGTGVYGTDNYTYDAMGNRLTRSLVKGTTASTTYTYTTASTRLASAATGGTTLSYTYDAMGSVTARKLGNTTQAAYTYNADGRLATAAGAIYKYNAFGQRSVQTVTGGGNHFLFGPGGLLLAEHGVTGAAQRNYVYLNGRPLAVVDAAGTVNYILNDHLGQPQKMLNAAGAVTWHRVAGVYGDTASQPVGTTAANPNRFPGQQQDAVTGLYYNYFRDYDPATGRYLEADPIGLNGGVNVYAYVGGNPVNAVDFYGLETVFEHYTGLPDYYRTNAMNGIAGASDALTFGATNKVRDWLGLNKEIDPCSTAYRVGEGVGVGAGLLGGSAALRGLAGGRASGLGDLTVREAGRIQNVVNRAGRPLDVVGSAARGARRPGSDIDYVVPPGSLPYYRGLEPRLPGIDRSHGIIPGFANPNIGPSIRFEPR